MKGKHLRTLKKIHNRPIFGTIKWSDIEALFIAIGAKVEEREGSRVAVILRGSVKVFHRPHPKPDTDKCVVASVKIFLNQHNIKP